MRSKLDGIVGKRTIKEMLDEPVKENVLDVKLPDSKEEKALERIAEKGYEPNSVDVLKETGKDVVDYGKAISEFIGNYILGPQLFVNLMPYISPYLFSKRENTISNKYSKTIDSALIKEYEGPAIMITVLFSYALGGLGAICQLVYLYGHQAIQNKNYWLFSIPVVTNVASFLYERIQVNKLKLASKNKSLEGVVKDEK